MYKNPTPVAVALIRVKNRPEDSKAQGLLVGRRTIDPCKGEFSFPGGYVDELESAEVAAARELQEETGIIVPAEHFRPVATRITPQNRVLIFCFTETTLLRSDLHQFTPNNECDALSVRDQFDTLCFPTHTDVLRNRGLWDPATTVTDAATTCVELIKHGMTRDGRNTSHYQQSVKHIQAIEMHFGLIQPKN